MKIKLYTQKGCVNCTRLKEILAKILPEFQLCYSSAVCEVDIDSSSEVLADLIMMGAHSVPVIVLGSSALIGPSVMDIGELRKLISSNLDALRQNN